MNLPTWSVLLFPLLIVSGAIAYAGDVIGKNLGKKRLSVLGLRPRQTAHLFSIGSGVLILLISFGLIVTLSRDARTALFHLKQIQEAQRLAQRDANALKKKNDAQTLANHALERKNYALRTEVDKNLAAKARTEEEWKKAEEALKKTHSVLVSAQRELAIVKSERDKVGKQMIGDLAKYERAVKESKAEVARLTSELDRLSAAQRVFGRALIEVATTPNPVVYNIGQIVRSTVIDTNRLGRAEMRQAILALLERASDEALRRGAVAVDDRAVVLSAVKDFDGQVRTESQQLDDEVETILRFKDQKFDGYDGRAIIDLVARANCIKGDEVQAALKSYPNEMVYRRGEEISQTTLAPGLTAAAIFSRLQQFTDQGRGAAESRKLRPREGSVYDPETTANRIFDCIDKVRQSNSRVVVRMRADADIRSADYLRVRFDATAQ